MWQQEFIHGRRQSCNQKCASISTQRILQQSSEFGLSTTKVSEQKRPQYIELVYLYGTWLLSFPLPAFFAKEEIHFPSVWRLFNKILQYCRDCSVNLLTTANLRLMFVNSLICSVAITACVFHFSDPAWYHFGLC